MNHLTFKAIVFGGGPLAAIALCYMITLIIKHS